MEKTTDTEEIIAPPELEEDTDGTEDDSIWRIATKAMDRAIKTRRDDIKQMKRDQSLRNLVATWPKLLASLGTAFVLLIVLMIVLFLRQSTRSTVDSGFNSQELDLRLENQSRREKHDTSFSLESIENSDAKSEGSEIDVDAGK